MLTVDPRTFRGRLGGTFGPDLENRKTTTAPNIYAHAKAAVNAGFFVLDPKAGAPGDPAGAGVYNGVLESETIASRPALVLHSTARHSAVVRPEWRGTLRTRTGSLLLDGLNRVPGLIRNCGGDSSDQPRSFRCTTSRAPIPTSSSPSRQPTAASTPTGPGAEVVLDRRNRVAAGSRTSAAPRSARGSGRSRASETSPTPSPASEQVRWRTSASPSPRLRAGAWCWLGVSVINGGPQLLRDGPLHITQAQDGMVHPGDPSFAYGWVLQRNPRTFAGVDAQGRTLLVTVDGRQIAELGLSIPETAQASKALGMRDAVNLDGGGSTAMAIDSRLISHPSDATGERPVGDAIYIR